LTAKASRFVAEAAVKRLAGERSSRSQALVTASAAAIGAGLTVYRLLRSGDGQRNS
jgi:hypothetical protein